MEVIAQYILRFTLFEHLLHPSVSKFNKFRTPKAMQFKLKERITTRFVSIS